MIEIKTLSLFQGNPQNNDHMSDFWNSFTQQIQQFLCTRNSYLKEPETKKIKKKQINRHNSHDLLANKIKGLKMGNNKIQKQKKKKKKS